MTPNPAPTPVDPLVGRTICGCDILRLLGQGGMGNLYQGRQLSLDRIVAVKVLAPALSSNSEFLGRFRREARALANLLHPNIVAVHDFGEEEGVHAIVMECVEGESVADMLTRTDTIPTEQSVDIIRQVAEGLACAHSRAIIHCDLKPENILVTPGGVAKVIDFGLAKSLRGDAMRITQDGSILGTPTYMSPEQCEGLELDGRTDIYSLGGTFYRMVAGRDVFEADNAFALMLKHKSEPPTNPRKLNPDLPASVAKIILHMLEKSRDARYQAASDVVAALAKVQDEASNRDGEPGEVIYPREDVAFAREALRSGMVSAAQLRECLAELDELRAADPDSGLSSVMVRKALLSEEQAEQMLAHGAEKETARRDQQFARFALDAGMATSEQVTHCMHLLRRRGGRTLGAKLSKIMVEEGILDQQQVVALLLRQLKDAQRREDADLIDLIRARDLLSDEQIDRCVREQKREEAQGHHKVLRQIIVELNVLPAPKMQELLVRKVRTDIDSVLAEHEGSKTTAKAALLLDEATLKLEEIEPCPACGKPVEVGAATCPACGRRIEEACRDAARQGAAALARQEQAAPAGEAEKAQQPSGPAGQWEIRLSGGEVSKPLGLKALAQLAREQRLKPTTVLRGPLTEGVWRQARHTPRLCRAFGVCYYCEAKLPPRVRTCPSCGVNPDLPCDA